MSQITDPVLTDTTGQEIVVNLQSISMKLDALHVTASNVSYDNSLSSLDATNVQNAIDSLEGISGKSPRINSSGIWEVWDASQGAYVSTGYSVMVNPPKVATTVSAMTNHDYVYIYTGSESGYQNGYWYYWNGSAWTVGGAYQVAATDKTLTISDAPADSKVTGDNLTQLKSALGLYEFAPLLTSDDVVESYYVRGDTGYTISSGTYVCTDFVPIDEKSIGLKLKANCYFGSIIGCAFYDSTKTFISGVEDGNAWTQKIVEVTIPNNARYFRTTLQASAYSQPSDFGISYQKRIIDLENSIAELDSSVEEVSERCTVSESAISSHKNAILELSAESAYIPGGFSLGDTSNGSLVVERSYRMVNETVYNSIISGTLTTDWTAYTIYVWKLTGGTWTAIGWQTKDYALDANAGYRFVIARANFEASDLTTTEQNDINTKTKIYSYLWSTINRLKNTSMGVPRVMNRQGEGYGYPDNSLPAVKAALDDGFKMIRISVAVTSDNVFYCTHVYELANNSTLQYVKQNGSVYTENIDINTSTSAFINSLTYKDYPIPTLDAVMSEVVKHNVDSITWELKGTFTDAQLQQLIETANFYNVPVVYSGGYLEIDQLTAVNTNLNIGVIFNYTDSLGSGFKTRYANKYKTMRYDCYWGDTVSVEQVKTVIHPDVKLKFGAGTTPNASEILSNYIRWVDVSEINYPMANFRS